MTTTCGVSIFLTTLLVLVLFYISFAPTRTLTDSQLLAQLRADLLKSPSLRLQHSDILSKLQTWTILIASDFSKTDFASRSLHLRIHLDNQTRFDRATLILVLLHELVHATLGQDVPHDASFFQKEQSCIEALKKDGILQHDARAHPMYPAQIINRATLEPVTLDPPGLGIAY